MEEQVLFAKIAEAVLQGNAEASVAIARDCLAAGIDPLKVIIEGANKGMKEAGDLYEQKEYFVPELLVTAEAMTSVVEFLKPHIKTTKTDVTGTVVLGVVSGDIHSIGKNIVKVLLETYGITVIDLGEDVAKEAFVEAARKNNADIIGMSSLMTTSMNYMGEVIEELKKQKLNVMTIIGGSPVNDKFREKIGATAYANDGNRAAKMVLELMKKRRASYDERKEAF